MHFSSSDIYSLSLSFGTHPHREFEIFSYIVDGQLEQSVPYNFPISRGRLPLLFPVVILWATLKSSSAVTCN